MMTGVKYLARAVTTRIRDGRRERDLLDCMAVSDSVIHCHLPLAVDTTTTALYACCWANIRRTLKNASFPDIDIGHMVVIVVIINFRIILVKSNSC